MVTGFRKLKVESVFVNNAFLLSNGLLIIHWQVKNALLISVQGKWIGSKDIQMMVYAVDSVTTVSIRIQGLFSSYKKRFVIHPLAALVVPEPPSPHVAIPPLFYKFYLVHLPNLHLFNPVVSQDFITDIPVTEVIIPPFQTENHANKRLLQNP